MLVAIYWEIGFCGEFESENERSSRSAVILFEKIASSLAGRVTRIFEKWAPAKLQTISVENGTNTSAATDSSTHSEDSVNEFLPIYSH